MNRKTTGLGVLSIAFAALLAATPASAQFGWLFGEDHPNRSEITDAVEDELPEWLSLDSVEIRTQEMRQGLIEYSETRVLVTLRADEPLFRRADPFPDGRRVIRPVLEAGETWSAPALVNARPIGDGWEEQVLWDEGNKVLFPGRPRDRNDDALVVGTSEFDAHVAMLEEQFRVRNESMSIPLEGSLACRSGVFEIDRLVFDPVEERGVMVGRQIGADGNDRQFDVRLGLRYDWETNAYRISGSGTSLTAVPQPGTMPEVRWTFDRCDAPFLRRLGTMSDELQAYRARERAALDTLAAGPIQVTGRFGGEDVTLAAEIVERRERGLRLTVEHPVFVNATVRRQDIAVSTIDLRLMDPGVPGVVRLGVEGRGEPFLQNHCNPTVSLSPEGTLLLETDGGFACRGPLTIAGKNS
jgi:hypothetical protein